MTPHKIELEGKERGSMTLGLGDTREVAKTRPRSNENAVIVN